MVNSELFDNILIKKSPTVKMVWVIFLVVMPIQEMAHVLLVSLQFS